MDDDKSRKYISFDFKVDNLKNIYSVLTGKTYTEAYRDFGSYLCNNGFRHVQGSCYDSVNEVNVMNVQLILSKFATDNKWFPYCLTDLNVTNIGKVYNLNNLFQNQAVDIFDDLAQGRAAMEKETPDTDKSQDDDIDPGDDDDLDP